jgi:hypothetical protein
VDAAVQRPVYLTGSAERYNEMSALLMHILEAPRLKYPQETGYPELSNGRKGGATKLSDFVKIKPKTIRERLKLSLCFN